MPTQQAPLSIMMIRPAAFGFNDQTASSNSFQHTSGKSESPGVHCLALAEFDKTIDILRSNDLDIRVFDDAALPPKPDAIFPNNWISFHPDGKVVLYPMMVANRRLERRMDIVDKLSGDFKIEEIIDLSPAEKQNQFLEGTGSVVFDHVNRTAYACRSPRTNESVLRYLCEKIGYRSIVFDAVDEHGAPVYHTNVMMSIGSKFAMLCLDAIHKEDDQEEILAALATSSHQIIAISYAQMRSFCGNVLEVTNTAGLPVILISETSLRALLPGQLDALSKHGEPVAVEVSTIEKFGGGGIRCMVSGIHLPRIS